MSAGKRISRFTSRRASKILHQAAGQAVACKWIEALECRRLLATSVVLSGTQLQITGDDDSVNGDKIDVLESSQLVVVEEDDVVIYTQPSGTTISSILLSARAGNDNVTIEPTVSSLKSVTVNGGAGNDTLRGGIGNDTISGDDGNDTIHGGAGNDSLTGGNGNDTIEGDGGDDTMTGGTGNDTYRFAGSGALCTVAPSTPGDVVVESPVSPPPDNSSDTLDFTGLSGGNGVGDAGHARGTGLNLYVNTAQVGVVPNQLTLQLSTDTGIENVLGSPYDDVITGNTRPNRIEGRNGGDHIFGGDDNDTLDGGNGDSDCVHGEDGNDWENGGPGSGDIVGFDPTTGGSAVNAEPDDGNDTIYGGTGADEIGGDGGFDLLFGDTGWAGSGSNAGTAHNDDMVGGADGDTMYGGDGDDYMEGGGGDDRMYGDFLSHISGFVPDEGNDTMLGNGGDDSMIGDSYGLEPGYGNGDDSLMGGDGADTLIGDGGDGYIWDSDINSPTYGLGVLGDDTLAGEQGDDVLKGENDADVYRFVTDTSTDVLGTDQVVEAAPTTGVVGRDSLDFHKLLPPTGVTGIAVNISLSTTQRVSGTALAPQLSLLLTDGTGIEDVTGSDDPTRGNDSITGNAYDNVLRGGSAGGDSGSDTIRGGGGNDTLHGEGGIDYLFGDAGNDLLKSINDSAADVLEGGSGTDTSILNQDRDSIDTNPAGDIENWT